MNAAERASQLFEMRYANVSPRANAFVKRLTGEVGTCSETIHAALAKYAEVVEGFEPAPDCEASVEDYAFAARLFLDQATTKIQRERNAIDSKMRDLANA